MIDCVDEEREAEDIGEENKLMSHVAADLTNPHKEVQSCHPFVRAQSRFAREVMEMRDQAFHHIGDALVGGLGIDEDSVFGNVVYC